MSEVKKRHLGVGAGRIYLSESLCGPYREISGVCNTLFKDKVIHKNYTFNGSLYVILEEGQDKRSIQHMNDLIELVGEDAVNQGFPRARPVWGASRDAIFTDFGIFGPFYPLKGVMLCFYAFLTLMHHLAPLPS